jgi:RNA polymerase sigma factor (sigma-70 family)
MAVHLKDKVELARQGELSAFDELFESHQERLLSFCRKLIKDEAEDVLSTVYQHARRGIVKFRGDSSFSTWLFAIARNVCLDTIRKRSENPLQVLYNEKGDLVDEPAAHGPSLEQAAEFRRILEAIGAKGLQFKPPWDTYDLQIFRLHCQEGYSFRIVAEKLGMGESAVKRRFERKIVPVLKAVADEFGIEYVPKRGTGKSDRKEERPNG